MWKARAHISWQMPWTLINLHSWDACSNTRKNKKNLTDPIQRPSGKYQAQAFEYSVMDVFGSIRVAYNTRCNEYPPAEYLGYIHARYIDSQITLCFWNIDQNISFVLVKSSNEFVCNKKLLFTTLVLPLTLCERENYCLIYLSTSRYIFSAVILDVDKMCLHAGFHRAHSNSNQNIL